MTQIWILVSIWFVQGAPEPLYIKQSSQDACMAAAKLEAEQGNGLAYCVPGYAKRIHEYEKDPLLRIPHLPGPNG